MSNTVHVAAIQMTCRLGDKAANLAQAEALLADLAEQADVVCLPELFSTGYQLDVLGERLAHTCTATEDASSPSRGAQVVTSTDSWPARQRLCGIASASR